jgi:hypothetical protein
MVAQAVKGLYACMEPVGSLQCSQKLSTGHYLEHGLQSASYSAGTRGSVPEVKSPGREAYHSYPSNAEARCEEIYLLFHPSIRLNAVVLN